MKNYICKVKQNEKVGTGFFCKIPILGKNNLFFLITNNNLLNEKDIENNKIIKLTIYDKEKKKDIDITIIEIKPDIDKINNFLELDDEQLELEGNKKTIYILHYTKDKKLVSYGLITDIIEEKIINFNFEIEKGSSCSPILSINNFKVIGVYYGGSNKNNKNLNLDYLLNI